MDTGPDALFPVTLIVGVGLLGGSLGLALRERGLSTTVIGTDSDAHALSAALLRGALTQTTDDWRDAVPDADVVVFCTPPAHIAAHLPDACERARPRALVTDVGSTKGQTARAAGAFPNFVGGHPMAGTEQSGIAHARADLFDGATWAVCPTPSSTLETVEKLHALAAGVGARPMVLDADTHDAMAAVTSHLPHALASALMAQADAARAGFPDLPLLAAGSLRDGTRVAGSSPMLWRDVCLSNRAALLPALHQCRARLLALEAALEAGDADAVEAFFRDGQHARRDWYGP